MKEMSKTGNKNQRGHQTIPHHHNEKLLKTSTKPSAAFVTTAHFVRNLNVSSNAGILPCLSTLPAPAIPDKYSEYSQASFPPQRRHWVNTLGPKRDLHLEVSIPRPAPQEESGNPLWWYLVSVLPGPIPTIAIECADLVIEDRLVKVYPISSRVRSTDLDSGL